MTGQRADDRADAPAAGRLLVHPAGEATWNMGVDQALLESVAAGGPPTLRFYSWQQATLSLGYFQMIDDRAGHRDSHSLVVVRRATGGGAIIHDRELTYSLVVPLPQRNRRAVQTLYDQVHRAIRQTLGEWSVSAARFADAARPASADPPPFLCFQRRTAEDLVVAGYKVVGSAQRRAAGAVLQHGSILLQVSRFAPQLPGIAELTGRWVTAAQLVAGLARTIPVVHDDRGRRAPPWVAGQLTAAETRRAAEVSLEKFSDPRWTHRRSTTPGQAPAPAGRRQAAGGPPKPA